MGRKKIRFCQKCGGDIKNRSKTTKICVKCYREEQARRKGENSPFYNPTIRICINCGGPKYARSKIKLCKKCYDNEMINKNRCKKCGAKRAKNTSEYCQDCYRGPITKRWNSELTDEFRKEGRTINPEYSVWRLSVFERDKYTCKKCGDNKGGNLIAHHLYSFKDYPILRTILSNGITLCESCHKDFHQKYTYFHNTKEQMDLFMIDGGV